MDRELILHIGMPKCGSTYLQRVLLQNQAALEEVGVAYPHDGTSDHAGNGSGMFEADVARLDAAFGNSQRLVLSHEDLFSKAAKARPLAEAVRDLGVRVHLVAFIRPFSEFVFGDYSQNMKQKFNEYMRLREPYAGRNFPTFSVLRCKSLQPAVRFRNWITALTLDGVEPPIFTLARHKDIQQTITPVLNGADMDWSVPRYLANPSLRMEDCDRLADLIRDRSVPEDEVLQVFRDALHQTGEPDAGKTAERVAWIEAIFEKQNTELEQAFKFNNRKQQDAL